MIRVVLVLCALFSAASASTLRRFELWLSDEWRKPDGVQERSVFLFNKSLPGPELHVEQWDTVELVVWNKLMDRTTSLHVHGLVFGGLPWQDGVAMVTQCPILPGSVFTYRFLVQNAPGTYWYHSHVGAQTGDGAFGSFIVHEAGFLSRPPTGELDKVLAVSAWWWRDQHSLYQEWNSFSQGLTPADHDHLFFMQMKSVLINGKAPETEELSVVGGSVGKFRLLSSCSPVPFVVSVDNHTMEIVAMDGKAVKPRMVVSLMLLSGQRFDVRVVWNRSPGAYWLRATAYHHHGKMAGMQGKTGSVLLRYKGVDPLLKPTTSSSSHKILSHSLVQPTLKPLVATPPPRPTRTLTMQMDRKIIPGVGLRWFVGNLTLQMPNVPLLIAAHFRQPYPHTSVTRMTRGEVVDVILVNLGNSSGPHPWHFHGHEVWLLGMGVDAGTYKGEPLNEVDPPLCDIFEVGSLRLRFLSCSDFS
jgi:iron transport multicopper oxidase